MMSRTQMMVALRMLVDPRLPLEQRDIFRDAILDPRPGNSLFIAEERLKTLSNYLPDLVSEYRQAGNLEHLFREAFCSAAVPG